MKSYLLAAYQWCRILQFRLLSDCQNVVGAPWVRQPVQLVGKGTIRFARNVTLGWYPSPFFITGSIYIESRSPCSVIDIGEHVLLNNNVSLISEGEGIFIGKWTMIGTHVSIIDSDFHDLGLDPLARRRSGGKKGKVIIGENVGIGANVRILRGAEIGDNSIIADGSLVIGAIPANVIAMGQPARVVYQLSAKSGTPV